MCGFLFGLSDPSAEFSSHISDWKRCSSVTLSLGRLEFICCFTTSAETAVPVSDVKARDDVPTYINRVNKCNVIRIINDIIANYNEIKLEVNRIMELEKLAGILKLSIIPLNDSRDIKD